MANELIINASLPETRIALMENGEIQELLIERASGKGIVGNIYKGRVTRVLPGMQAAFVDIGLEKAAFLYVDDVFVHSEIWEEEEGTSSSPLGDVQAADSESEEPQDPTVGVAVKEQIVIKPRVQAAPLAEGSADTADVAMNLEPEDMVSLDRADQDPVSNAQGERAVDAHEDSEHDLDSDHDLSEEDHGDPADEGEGDEDPRDPVAMGADPTDSDDSAGGESSGGDSDVPEGTVAAPESGAEGTEGVEGAAAEGEGEGKKPRRGRRGGRFRKKKPATAAVAVVVQPVDASAEYPETYHDQVADTGDLESDRSGLAEQAQAAGPAADTEDLNRPVQDLSEASASERRVVVPNAADRPGPKPEFKAQRARDRRVRPKVATRPVRTQANIQDLLKEGQEVLVQVAKDPIATKGARLTCHISLPGRHLVCMPTIDHVGVSRRIDREDERRRLREFVERHRPRNLGFIVRTASGKQQSEKRIKQDVEYLTRIWDEIKTKAGEVTAPALVYEDLNSVLRAIRDWVTEDIDKVIVDSRYHFNEIQKFVSHFMPSLRQKVELYHGDIPIFDAYGISTELSRALERKVWLKSGGYIVIDQAEALVAIDVNTGRYVGKKNLEDTILKTNLEAVQEIAYQLRLRNCGGIIILDLIDMEKDENKHRVYRALEDALSRDRARPTILKISELGLVEMTRKRTRDTIVRTLCESCTHCEGKGFIKAKQTVAYEAMREMEREGIERDTGKVLVQAHPDVIDILAIDERDTLDQLEKKYRKQIYLQAVPDFHPEQFEVTAEKQGEKNSGDIKPKERPSSDRHERGDRDRKQNPRREVIASGPVKLPTPLAVPIPRAQPEPKNPEKIQSGHDVSAMEKAIADRNETLGNGIPVGPEANPMPVGLVEHGSANLGNAVNHSQQDSSFDEEDRLAFLRAQAAQDAALARLGSNSSAPLNGRTNQPSNRDHRNDGRRGSRGRRPGSHGGGSGRFQQRNEHRGPSKPFGYKPKDPTPVIASDPTTSGGGSGGDGGGSKGGAGDRSQPF